jgi:hypothetical protein
MVVHSVLFEGKLSRTNSIVTRVEESYCLLKLGNWRLRLDSLAVSSDREVSLHVSVGCNLVQSPQKFGHDVFSVPTALHVFAVHFDAAGKKQLLSPGLTDWREFTGGSQQVELKFRNAANHLQYEPQMDLSFSGVLLLEFVN